jgi:hypothetical protein
MSKSQTTEKSKTRRERSTQREMALRDARIVRHLAKGVSIEEIAAREDMTVRRARERASAILAQRAATPTADYVQLQITRLNEAFIVAYSAMNNGNLHAVDRVIRITREYDRYHALAASLNAPAAPPLALPAPPLSLPAPAAPPLAVAGPEAEYLGVMAAQADDENAGS